MTPLLTGYNIPLVIVSVAIATLAAYTALDLAGRITATQGRAQLGWLVSGATAMGIGIWSMHFIGMLAFRLPLPVHYNFFTVGISILPAILASGLALFLVSRPTLGALALVLGSLFMGLGIASMHYIGMAAMDMAAVMHYDRTLVGLSIVVAIAVSFAGLSLVFRLREDTSQQKLWHKIVAALIMGAAIPTMHYIGMAAACFQAQNGMAIASELHPPASAAPLAAAVIIGTLIILGLAILTAFFDRRLTAQIVYAQAIQERQRYFKTVLQGIQVGVLVIAEDGAVQLSNRAMLDRLHLATEAELQQLWVQATVTDTDTAVPLTSHLAVLRDTLQPLLEKIAAKQPINNAIVSVTAPNAMPTTLLVNAVPLTPPGATDTQMVCTFSDITELKRTETRLKESEAKFRALAKQEEIVNHLSTQIRQSLDLQTILQTVVGEVRQFFDTDRALIYQFDADWRGQVVLEDVAAPWHPTIGEAADDCFPAACLERYRNGQIRSFDNILEANLHPDHLQFLQRLQVQANLIVPIMVADELWGLLIVHQCSGPRIWQASEGQLLYRLALQLGIAIQQAALYAQAEQNARQAQAQATQLRASETQLKQQTQALQQTLQEVQSLQLQLVQNEKMSSLGQLVAGVAHEINNPVNFIHGNLSHVTNYAQDLLGFVALYQQHYPEPVAEIADYAVDVDLEFLQDDLAKILASMKVGTDRIRQIVLSLRNFSRMDEAGFKTANIHEGLDSTLLILQHRLKAKPDRPGIEVTRDYAELPLVACYPGQLNQVLMNILANAIDALEESPTAIDPQTGQAVAKRITIRTTLLANQWVQIAIADNGPGMPELVKGRIFDPFFTTKPVGKGTGMGLSISYQIIVEKHGGKLDCFSSPDRGTEFVIQIPVEQAMSQAA